MTRDCRHNAAGLKGQKQNEAHRGTNMRTAPATWALILIAVSNIALAANVRQFQPQGRIDDQRRATVQFSADMVKLDDVPLPLAFLRQ